MYSIHFREGRNKPGAFLIARASLPQDRDGGHDHQVGVPAVEDRRQGVFHAVRVPHPHAAEFVERQDVELPQPQQFGLHRDAVDQVVLGDAQAQRRRQKRAGRRRLELVLPVGVARHREVALIDVTVRDDRGTSDLVATGGVKLPALSQERVAPDVLPQRGTPERVATTVGTR